MTQGRATTGGAPLQLRDYLAVIRLHKWSIILITALTLAAAVFSTYRQRPVYRSQAQVLVEPASFASASGTAQFVNNFLNNQPQPLNLETEMQVAKSDEVARLAARGLGPKASARELLAGLSVERAENTEILTFIYTHAEPGVPQRAVQALAEGYLDFRRQQAQSDLRPAIDSLKKRISDLKERLDQTQTRLATASPLEAGGLQGRADGYIEQIDTYQQQLRELTDPQALSVGDVVQAAATPQEVTPDQRRNVALALLIGLVLGTGVAFLRERLDDRLRDSDDLQTHARAAVLSAVPRISRWGKRKSGPVVMLSQPNSQAAEAYWTLRTSLLFAASRRGVKTIMITSPNAGEGKTTTTANLGVAMAQSGRRVLLICADLRRPQLHEFFDLPNEAGLTSVLLGEKKALEAVSWARFPEVRIPILPSGPLPGNPPELLASDAMEKLLTALGQTAEFLLIDVGPVLPVADALTLAPLVDAVLLVADAERTRRGDILRARQQLEHVNAHVIGTILNRFDPSKAAAPPRYYSYYPSSAQVEQASRPGPTG